MSILSNTELQNFTGAAIDLFNTASQFHYLIVHKEPTKTIDNVDDNEYYGYGQEQQNPENYSFVQNSGIYNVVVVSIDKDFKNEIFDPIPISLMHGQKLIKVGNNCKEYIDNGKNILFNLDGQEFNSISNSMSRNYGGLEYWYYVLERTT